MSWISYPNKFQDPEGLDFFTGFTGGLMDVQGASNHPLDGGSCFYW